MARLTGEPAIGVELGQAADPRRLGAAGAALVEAKVSTPPALPPAPEDEQILRALGRLIERLASSGELSLAAERLGLSPRSLRRRLSETGESFEDRVDAWRHLEARRLLDGAGAPVATVAQALGYADPSHCLRAFRRWEGATPQASRVRRAGRPWREMAMAKDAAPSRWPAAPRRRW